MAYEYEGSPRIRYHGDGETVQFIRVCPLCGRFVATDDVARFGELDGQPTGANATCSRCGRIEMLFEGYVDDIL